MITPEQIATSPDFHEALTEYLTCRIYLDKVKNGTIGATPGVREAVGKRLVQVTGLIMRKARRTHPNDVVSDDFVQRAAVHFLTRQAIDPDYYLRRLAIR